MRHVVVALLALLPGCNALAQVSAQVNVASDYVFRGVSLTDNRPAAAAEVNYDSSIGWFAGAQISQTRLYAESHAEPEFVVDAGYAYTLGSGLTLEAGATYSIFPNFTFWNYHETFVGLLAQSWNARLYYAPDYFGRGGRTLYVEFNYVHALDERFRLLAHLGALRSTPVPVEGHARTLDASLGIGAKFGNGSIEFKRVATDHASYLYPLAAAADRGEWVLSLSYAY